MGSIDSPPHSSPSLKDESQAVAQNEDLNRTFLRPRILHLIGSNCVGGPEKQILHHATDMKISPFEVQVGSFKDSETQPEILFEASRRNLKTICFSGGLRLHVLRDLVQFLNDEQIGLLCTHGFKANVLGYLASLQSKAQHVAFLRGWTAETARVILYEKLERFALARSQTVVCVSGQQAERVRKLRGARSSPLIIENAMLPPFERTTDLPTPTRFSLGISEDAFVFGSVGRLSAEKGHRFFLEAFAELYKSSAEKERLYLLVIGEGREEETLREAANRLGIIERVYFAGYQGNCTGWMRLMDCMVQPSLTEGTPNSVLEALCLGVPVVATAVGGVPALIHDGENGLLVPAQDVKALTGAMKTIFEDPELRKSLLSGAVKSIGSYAPERQRALLLNLYESLSLSVPNS